MSETDRLEKSVLLRAPRARVFRALTDAAEFGAWFRMKLDGPFVEGKAVFGRVTYPGFEHLRVELRIERIEPERSFAYRWHPHAVDEKRDYSGEKMTLVEFRLDDEGKDTRLTIVESGFDQIPLDRRATAFRMNGEGWGAQCENLRRHVEG